jgi:dihydrofolate reductase
MGVPTRTEDMRKLAAVLLMTLDGVVESPDRWPAPHLDVSVHEVLARAIARSDAVLLGRNTYLELAERWPTENGIAFARYLNDTSKYVVSSKLEFLAWSNSSLVPGHLSEEVTRLKELPGKDILVIGSPTLVRSLLRDGLLDELALIVHPIVAGTGRRLFEDLSFGTALRLVDSHTFHTGVVSLTFEPRTLAVAA